MKFCTEAQAGMAVRGSGNDLYLTGIIEQRCQVFASQGLVFDNDCSNPIPHDETNPSATPDDRGQNCRASSDSSAISNRLRRGIRILTVVPRPTSLPTSSRKERPNNPCSRRRNRDSAWRRGCTAKKTRSTSVEGTPCPSSLMLISNHSPIRRTRRRRHPAFGEDCKPCWTAFCTSGLSEK